MYAIDELARSCGTLARIVHCLDSRSVASQRLRMKIRTRIAKWPPLRSPFVKYGLIGAALTLWGFGLLDQLDSTAALIKYLLLSLLIVAVAVI